MSATVVFEIKIEEKSTEVFEYIYYLSLVHDIRPVLTELISWI